MRLETTEVIRFELVDVGLQHVAELLELGASTRHHATGMSRPFLNSHS